MYYSRIISVAGRSGILYASSSNVPGSQEILPKSMVLFSLDNLSNDVFQETLFIRPDMPPDQRLIMISISPDATPEDTQPLRVDLYAGQLIQPVNGTLSPDGQYAMFAIKDFDLNAALYVYDIERNICGRVNLDALGEYTSVFIRYKTPNDYSLQGFHCLGNNRVLLAIGDEYRLYELKS